jgi:hypothetical protein
MAKIDANFRASELNCLLEGLSIIDRLQGHCTNMETMIQLQSLLEAVAGYYHRG